MTVVDVDIERTVLTLVSDPTQSVQCWTADHQGSETRGGDFRTTAGGGRIVVTTDDDDVERPVTLQDLPYADYLKVRAWRGRKVLLRDLSGLRVFGAYLAVQHTEQWIPGEGVALYTAQITLTELPYDESV